jgi:hypothetical protein
MQKYINYIRKYNSDGMLKYADKLNIYNKKFKYIYLNYINIIKKYLDDNDSEIIKILGEATIKKICKNVILEYIRNNEYLLFKYIKNKYTTIHFDCIDIYNYYKYNKKNYIFSYDNNKLYTYQLKKYDYIKVNKKVPFKYKLENELHNKGNSYIVPHQTLSFIDFDIYSNKSKYTNIYNFSINESYNKLKYYIKEKGINVIYLTQYNIQEIGHTNSIIIDNDKKKIIRLEPLVKEINNGITCLINKLSKESGYELFSIKNIYNVPHGLQKTHQTGEWCSIWSYYMTILYFEKGFDIFKILLLLHEYNTNFMFYYIFDILIDEKIINKELVIRLINKVIKYLDILKYLRQNEIFKLFIKNLVDYSILPNIIKIFDKKFDNIQFFKKNIHENFDINSLNLIKNFL